MYFYSMYFSIHIVSKFWISNFISHWTMTVPTYNIIIDLSESKLIKYVDTILTIWKKYKFIFVCYFNY